MKDIFPLTVCKSWQFTVWVEKKCFGYCWQNSFVTSVTLIINFRFDFKLPIVFENPSKNVSFLKQMYLASFASHTIRKVKFMSKNSILTKPRHFHEFFTQIFLTIFLVKSKLSTAKKSKTTTFSRVFTQNNSTIFLGKSKLNFWTKNEDFEQCG